MPFIVNQSLYVDDLLAGGSSVEEVEDLRAQLCSTLAKVGFKLCKFRSSNSQVLEGIEPSLREKVPVQDITATAKCVNIPKHWA